MGFVNTVKGYFGAKRTEDPIKKFSSLNVRTNSLVTIDLTPFYIHNDFMVMENPGTDHQVTDIGELSIMGMDVFRFYTSSLTGEGEAVVQLIESDNGSKEIILFRPIEEVFPQTEEDWSEWIGTPDSPGLLQFDHFAIQDGEVVFERVWGSNLVGYDETVTPDESQKTEKYVYPVKSMLYRRDISDDGEDEFFEFLLVSVEDEERINMYIGFDVNSAGISIS